MAIEIIPKVKIKKISVMSIVFYLSLAIFLAFLVSYFVLDFWQKKINKELFDIKTTLEREKSPSEKNLEEKILTYQKKIEESGFLLANHRFITPLFDYLEKITHSKIQFSDFKLNSEEGVIDIKGLAESFEVLGQQALIFESQKFIKNINLSEVSINKEGKIEFKFQITLDPQIFNP